MKWSTIWEHFWYSFVFHIRIVFKYHSKFKTLNRLRIMMSQMLIVPYWSLWSYYLSLFVFWYEWFYLKYKYVIQSNTQCSAKNLRKKHNAKRHVSAVLYVFFVSKLLFFLLNTKPGIVHKYFWFSVWQDSHIWRRSRKITRFKHTARDQLDLVRVFRKCVCERESERERKVPSIFANITMSYVLSLYLVFSNIFPFK